jgi:ribosomal protein S12 methylthiotransferase
LLGFVREMEFERVGVFTYSDEDGTHAFDLPNKVDTQTAKRRAKRLMKEQERISLSGNKRRVGSIERVLFEGTAKETDLCGKAALKHKRPT